MGMKYFNKTSAPPLLYNVTLKIGAHPRKNVALTYTQISDWLTSNIGEEKIDWEWYYIGLQNSWQFKFNTEEDKVKFILKWI